MINKPGAGLHRCVLSDSGSLSEDLSDISEGSEPYLSSWSDKHVSFLRIETKLLRRLKDLQDRLTTYIEALPVLGFNSSKYDLNLIMASLVVELKLHHEKNPSVIKKGQAYQLIQTKQFRFLDLSSYLAPGVSYQKFLEMYGIAEKKSFFPYEFLDSKEKLDYRGLPPKEAFYSRLKGCNTLGTNPEEITQNYNALKEAWTSHGMVTLKNLLMFYNRIDVGPGMAAISKMLRFYKDSKCVDLFKIGISVPGIARHILFRTAKEQNAFFYSFSKNESGIHEDFKASITGGISQVFCRYAEKGKTFIRGDKKHPVEHVKGFDCNSLYLHCLSKPCPTGRMIHRTVEDGFRPRCELKQFYAIDYMDYLASKEGVFIEHKMECRGTKNRSFSGRWICREAWRRENCL